MLFNSSKYILEYQDNISDSISQDLNIKDQSSCLLSPKESGIQSELKIESFEDKYLLIDDHNNIIKEFIRAEKQTNLTAEIKTNDIDIFPKPNGQKKILFNVEESERNVSQNEIAKKILS